MKAIKLLFLILVSLALLGSKAGATITAGQTFSGGTAATNASSLALTVVAPDLTDGKYHYFFIAVASTGLCYATNDSGYSWNSYNFSGSLVPVVSLQVGRIYSGAGTTVTITTASAVPIAAVGIEFKSDAPLRLDRAASAFASSTTVSTGTTQTTSSANQIAVAALCHRLQSASTSGTFASPTQSYTEVVAGGVSTNNNASGADREVDLLYKALSATGTTTTGASVTGSNSNSGVVATFEEVSVTAAGRIPSIGN